METNEVAMTRASVATDFIMVVLELRVEEVVVALVEDVVERRIVGRNE